MTTMDAIDRFWEWFARTAQRFQAGRLDEALVADLEAHLFAVVRADWEIGPESDGATRLSVSPLGAERGDRETVRALLARAPELPGWVFGMYKPPRDWNLQFRVVGKAGTHEIDATLWELVVYLPKDRPLELVFKPDAPYPDHDPDELRSCAVTIVDGELGDELQRTAIGRISVVHAWNEREQRSARLLRPGT